jgi:hypothetical protein
VSTNELELWMTVHKLIGLEFGVVIAVRKLIGLAFEVVNDCPQIDWIGMRSGESLFTN